MTEPIQPTEHPELDRLLAYALSFPEAWLDHPWGEDHNVCKVGTKMFLTAGARQDRPCVSLRNQPEDVLAWRERYPDLIGPAPYMGARPWNLVYLDGPIPTEELDRLVEESYDSVVATYPRKHWPAGWVPPALRSTAEQSGNPNEAD
jgi:predicted DNA-binding protein (MmcQ/YjbR family)